MDSDTVPLGRRTVLASFGSGTLSGCLGRFSDTGNGVPADCPTTQDLDVDWPRELDAERVEAFVEAYDELYFLEYVYE